MLCFIIIEMAPVEMFNLVCSWSHVLTNTFLCHVVTYELFSFLPSSYSSSRPPQQLLSIVAPPTSLRSFSCLVYVTSQVEPVGNQWLGD